MNPDWRQFLTGAGAEIEHGRVASFGNPERELQVSTTGQILCDLSHQGVIQVQGDDAQSFLQSQFSNDISEVDDHHSQLSAWCDPKGRVLAIFRIFRRGEYYCLRLPEELLDPVLKRLRLFVLRADVTLEDTSNALIRIGYAGPEADTRLAEVLGEAPRQPGNSLQIRGLTVLRLPGPHPRFEIHGEYEAVQSLWSLLNAHAAPVGAARWALLDILAGIPTVYTETSGAFVPQMTNLHWIDGVNFNKGCYPGQEVVARMHYLGSLKRRMYRVRIEADTPPRPGDSLFAAGEFKQPAGRIVDAQRHPDGGAAALAVLQIANAEQHELRSGSADGPALTIEALPYKTEAS